jgi:hypothetical protein
MLSKNASQTRHSVQNRQPAASLTCNSARDGLPVLERFESEIKKPQLDYAAMEINSAGVSLTGRSAGGRSAE